MLDSDRDPFKGTGMTDRDPPRVLVATRVGTIAGAERLILQLNPALESDFQIMTATASSPWRDDPPLVPRDGDSGLHQLLAGRFDLIHTHLFIPGLLARLRRSVNPGFRWVHTVHYHHYRGLSFPRLRRWLDHRWIFPGTDVLIAIGDEVEAALPRLPQVRIIQNAIDLSRADRGPLQPDPHSDQSDQSSQTSQTDQSGTSGDSGRTGQVGRSEAVIGTVAMLRQEKGLEDLVRAMTHLRDHPIRLKIAGDGPERGRLETLVRELDLEGSVQLLGYVQDMEAFYGSLDLYVQPSISEPFGLAALESMRFGLPLVVADSGNLPRLIGDGAYGRSVPRAAADFPARLAVCLRQSLEDRTELSAAAETGRTFWQTRLSVSEMSDSYARAWNDALRPRVAMVSPSITHGGGGLQRQVWIQSSALVRRGHRTLIVQEADEQLAIPEHAAKWSHATVIQTNALRSGHNQGIGQRLQGVRFVVGALTALLRHRGQYDIIHAHQLYSPTLIGAIAKRLLGKPLVVRVTASGVLGEARELSRIGFSWLRRWAFRQVDAVIVMTAVMREEVRGMGFSDDVIHTIPNSVVVPANPVAIPRPSRKPRELRVLYTGRLSNEKSLNTVISAVGLLADSGVDAHLDLVGGTGGDRDVTTDLHEHAAELGVSDRVHFHGRSDDIPGFINRADVFVLASLSEGMSNALLEAMAAGLPCVVSDIRENRALIDEQVGRLFPVANAEGLAGELRMVAKALDQDPEPIASLGRSARARIASQHSEPAIAEQLDRLYRLCLHSVRK